MSSAAMRSVATVLQSVAGVMPYADAAKVLTTTLVDSGATTIAIAARVLQSVVVGSGAPVSIVAGSGGQLKVETEEEIDYNVSVFSTQGVICRFRGFWSSLPQLHSWNSEHWEPLIIGKVHIYPMAKGVFVAKFENAQDKNIILCDHYFSWEGKFMLMMIKPWYSDFNPSSEMFNKIPFWVLLPNLHFHLWVDHLLEEVGETLSDFLMVDAESSDILHSTFVRILVEMDVSKGLSAEIMLKSSKGCWVQSLDYEGILFQCRRCFKTCHVVAQCRLEKKTMSASWWKGASEQHYTVEKKFEQPRSFSQVVALDSQGVAASPLETTNCGNIDVAPSLDVSKGGNFDAE
ncbi:uncharacterized protein LOC131858381 [Cryptomeria japonica]|uniref:uncharacterized protein LOC131858381 n=1 Tax=Cryptomeria japonica TaxID=3369 RepID=UPI0027DAB108|nr:uncharacterized protein LOC131858381 [Cryptomeria japonica]